MKKVILYHGSNNIINKPEFGLDNKNNDYGLGFYIAENIELAKEWGVNEDSDGYANIYEIDLDGLKILNLNEYSILHWITILLQNRTFTLKK